MKQALILLIFLFFAGPAVCQQTKSADKKEIEHVLSTFMDCLVKKDSLKFYDLFYAGTVSWIGVTKQQSFADELKKDNTAKDYFTATYKEFYRSFFKHEVEEKFYNVQILEDGYIASVTFDYSFWYKSKKQNWGKESWGLIKTSGKWKIASVLFSLEYESIQPEPKQKTSP